MDHQTALQARDRFLSHDHVVQTLTGMDCERLRATEQGYGLWMLPGRCSFVVPEVGPYKECPARVLASIVAALEKSTHFRSLVSWDLSAELLSAALPAEVMQSQMNDDRHEESPW